MRWRLVRPLRLHPPDRGIDDFLRARPNETHEWPTADVGLVTDIDTPGDYQRFGGVTPD
jgi:CTP:molybdopterin cytidylyltransferase MocA